MYIDDIVLYTNTLEEHEAKFHELAERLMEYGLKVQPKKCEFLKKEVAYLGYVISKDRVKPDPKKIAAIQEFPSPANQKKIKVFLELAGYYRKFIPNFSRTSKPPTYLLKKDVSFAWKNLPQDAFDKIKANLISELIFPSPEFSKEFHFTTHAPDYALGGVLSQITNNQELPIAYTSRALNDADNYFIIEKELLAIVDCVAHLRPYLYGRKFTLYTDRRQLI